MSALEWNDRGNPDTAWSFVPRRRRAVPAEATIRPVLERLRRAERGDSMPILREAPSIAPAILPGAAPAGKSFLSIAARFAAAAGVCSGLAVVAISPLGPQREDRAPVAPAPWSKPVQTISYKLQDRFGDAAPALPSAAETQGQPLRDGAGEVTGSLRADGEGALPAPLQLWATVPPVLVAAGWGADAQAAFDEATPKSGDIAPKEAAEHRAHAARHHWRFRRHVARSHADQAAAKPDARPAAAAADNSLGAALHRLFASPVKNSSERIE
ncbi:MAG TPA: hypothetical protein VMG39_02325 [Pseudolabrys sp.]|nr:hypothetical protein [Pseudolabrys sp.]